MTSAPHHAEQDRRGARRYQIALPLRFAVVRKRDEPIAGSGMVVNISRTGLLYQCDETPKQGESIIIVADWPASGPDDERLKLLATGNIVRVRPPFVAVTILGLRLLPESGLHEHFESIGVTPEKAGSRSRVARAVASLDPDLSGDPSGDPPIHAGSGSSGFLSLE